MKRILAIILLTMMLTTPVKAIDNIVCYDLPNGDVICCNSDMADWILWIYAFINPAEEVADCENSGDF